MKSKEFDDLVRDSFENARLPYNPQNWQKLAAVLPEKRKMGIRYLLLPLASVAASVAMAIGITTWMNHGGDDHAVVAKSATTTRHIARTPAQQSLAAPAFEEVIPFEPIAQQETPTALPVAQHIPAPRKEVVPVNKMEEQPVQEILVASNNPVPSSIENTAGNVFYQNLTPAKKEKRTYISMNAGYNYGTLRNGYVMGFTVGRKLNETFYVESDVSIVGNMAGNNTKLSFTTGTATATGKYTDAPTQITKTIEMQKYYNIFYVQVAPSVNMKLAPKMSVGMGADMQRLMMDKKLTVHTSDGNNKKTLPMYDMGVTLKTEYNLTREIKASLNYRKGLNQALSGNKQLLDRDYLQLQLKFNILNK